MKRISFIFLQAVIILIGIFALAILIRFPLTEGRAKELDLISIYTDPFIIYGYITSIPFFIGLYRAFRLVGYIEQNKVYSLNSIKTLKSIKYCAIVLSVLIVAAGLFIITTQDKEEDPAGFLSISIIATFASIIVAIAAAKFEKLIQKTLDKKSGNDSTN